MISIQKIRKIHFFNGSHPHLSSIDNAVFSIYVTTHLKYQLFTMGYSLLKKFRGNYHVT